MPLKSRKIIVTGGPTREWLDPVRFLSNPSSGKMGIALADEAARITDQVIFIHGPIRADMIADRPYAVRGVETTSELLDAVMAELVSGCVLIMAAAPADFTPIEKSPIKIKKTSGVDEITLRLKKTVDILKSVAEKRQQNPMLADMFVAGFAAETTDIESYAKKKLVEKRLEMICLNDVGREDAGFGADTNIITVFTKFGERIELPFLSKQETARLILAEIDRLLERGRQPDLLTGPEPSRQ